MTKQIYNILAVAAGAALLWSCDDIAPDDRVIPMDSVKPKRCVLLEDFTGQICRNCPDAHRVMEMLSEQYGDALIPVSIHAGAFVISDDCSDYEGEFIGLGTEQGTQIQNQYGVTQWPSGVVDGNTGPINMDKWATEVRRQMADSTTVTLGCQAVLNDSVIDITVESFSSTPLTDASLHVWVTEDSIVAFQQVGGTPVDDYVHNHVFRTSVTPVIVGDTLTTEPHRYTVSRFVQPVMNDNERQIWNVANLHIVAFVRNASGVLQATRCSVKPIEE